MILDQINYNSCNSLQIVEWRKNCSNLVTFRSADIFSYSVWAIQQEITFISMFFLCNFHESVIFFTFHWHNIILMLIFKEWCICLSGKSSKYWNINLRDAIDAIKIALVTYTNLVRSPIDSNIDGWIECQTLAKQEIDGNLFTQNWHWLAASMFTDCTLHETTATKVTCYLLIFARRCCTSTANQVRNNDEFIAGANWWQLMERLHFYFELIRFY